MSRQRGNDITEHEDESPDTLVSSPEITSEESSCISSAPEEVSSTAGMNMNMLLVGCPRCFIYVMASDVDPKCPKCQSTVLLDFLNQEINKKILTAAS